LLAVDTGGANAGRHHSLFHLVRRHADFDLEGLDPVLEDAGLQVVERGPVDASLLIGLPNLRFVLAVAHPS
jgi:hypothetical protein